jgi:hypothetical protein
MSEEYLSERVQYRCPNIAIDHPASGNDSQDKWDTENTVGVVCRLMIAHYSISP